MIHKGKETTRWHRTGSLLAAFVLAVTSHTSCVHATVDTRAGAPSASDDLLALAPGPMPIDDMVENLLSDRPKMRRIHGLADRGKAGVEGLAKLLRASDNNAVLYLAAEALGASTHPAAADIAAKLYREGDEHLRADIAFAFAKHVGRPAIPVLKRDLDADGDQLQIAASAAMLLLTEDARYLDRLSQSAGNGGGWNLRNEFGRLGELANPLIPKLQRILETGDAERATNARKSLIAINTLESWSVLAPVMTQEIRTGEKLDRCRVLATVGRAGTAAVALQPALERVFENRDEPIEVRGYARWAMTQVDPDPREPKVFHVAQRHASASDDNPGTSDQPWASIQKAAETMIAGDRVIVHEGVYREWVRPFVGGTAEKPITYEAADDEQVVITGADPWRPDWQRVDELSTDDVAIFEADIERLAWDRPETWTRPVMNDVSARVEQIVLDGKRVQKAMTPAELTGEPFRVHYLSSEEKGERVVLSLPAGKNPGDFALERSVRPENFGPAVRGLGYVIVRGFEMVHAAPPYVSNRNVRQQVLLSAFNTHLGYRWTVEGNTIRSSSTVGLGIGQGYAYHHGDILPPRVRGSDESGEHLFLDNDCHDNGTAGIGTRGNGAIGLIVAHNRTHRNAWQGRMKDYESAGIKLMVTENTLLAHHDSRDNEAAGIWLDWMNTRTRVTRSFAADNTVWGIFVEGGWGPVVLDHNVVLRTRTREDMRWAAGLYSHDASGITAFHNVSLGNEGFALNFRYHRGKVMKGRQSEASQITSVHNIADNAGRGWAALAAPGPRASGNRFENNLYIDRGGKGRFAIMTSGGAGRARAVMNELGIAGEPDSVSLYDWRNTLGHGNDSAVLPHVITKLATETASSLERTAAAIRDQLFERYQAGGTKSDFESLYRNPIGNINAVRESASESELPLRMVDAMWVAPGKGVSLWSDGGESEESMWMAWNLGDTPWRTGIPADSIGVLQAGTAKMATADAKVSGPWPKRTDTPLTVRASDPFELSISTKGLPIMPPGFRTQSRGETLRVVPPERLTADRYGMLVRDASNSGGSWHRVMLLNRPALKLGRVTPLLEANGKRRIEVTAQNTASTPLSVKMHVRTDAGNVQTQRVIPPRTWNALVADLPARGDVVGADVSVIPASGPRMEFTKIMSFIKADAKPRRMQVDGDTKDWGGVARHDVEEFPDAIFPPAAAVAQMMSEGLGAEFATARQRDRLVLLIDVTDPRHLQEQENPGKAWQQDSVQVIFAPTDDRGRVLSDALHEWLVNLKDGKVRITPMTSPAKSVDLNAAVRRTEGNTVYEISLPLDAFIQSHADAHGSVPVAFSLQVNNDNGDGLNGFRWFGGIGGDSRHDPSALGRIWIDTP